MHDPTTEWITKEWWSSDLRKAKRAFFNDFVQPDLVQPEASVRLNWLSQGTRPKEFDQHGGLGKHILTLCDFYDRIGAWIYTAFPELIVVDTLFLMIWHSMRKTWVAIKPFIEIDRFLDREEKAYFDPTYMLGFELLFASSHALWQEGKITRGLGEVAIKHRLGINPTSEGVFFANMTELEESFQCKITAQNDKALELTTNDWVKKVLRASQPLIGEKSQIDDNSLFMYIKNKK